MPYARKDQLTWQRGGYYHLYNRGAHRLSIFREPENSLFALERIRRYSQEFRIRVIASCLLPNHYHLLVRQEGDARAGLLPQRVFNSYTKAYNRRYEHSGTLFEHRFQARQVHGEAHLRRLCLYIHANPVKHGLVSDPADRPYSNYLGNYSALPVFCHPAVENRFDDCKTCLRRLEISRRKATSQALPATSVAGAE